MSNVILWIITGALLVVGLFGTLIPAVPGIGFVFGGVLVYAIVTDFASISIATVVGLGIVALLALIADYVGSVIGVGVGGGKKQAIAGTVIGAILGALILGPLGLIVGGALGAFVGAFAGGQTEEQAARTALYSLLGVVGAAIVQFILALLMIVGFFLAVAL